MQRPVAFLIMFALAVVLVSASPAAAQEQSRQTYVGKFTSTAPGSSTGLEQSIHYRNPSEPEGKPYAVSQVIFSLPEGSIVDTSVPPQCGASEAEFQTSGADACPAETRVGDGSLVADTGAALGPFPRLIETDVTFFNNQDELILFAQSTNTPGPPIRIASRVAVRDRRELISSVPPLPGAPPPEPFLAIKDVFNALDPISTGRGRDRRAYITTPSTCPKSRRWTIAATFTYRDGVTQTVRSDTPCTGRAARPPEDRGQESDEDREKVSRPPAERFPRGGVEAGTGSTARSEPDVGDIAAGAGAALTALIAAGIGMRRLTG